MIHLIISNTTNSNQDTFVSPPLLKETPALITHTVESVFASTPLINVNLISSLVTTIIKHLRLDYSLSRRDQFFQEGLAKAISFFDTCDDVWEKIYLPLWYKIRDRCSDPIKMPDVAKQLFQENRLIFKEGLLQFESPKEAGNALNFEKDAESTCWMLHGLILAIFKQAHLKEKSGIGEVQAVIYHLLQPYFKVLETKLTGIALQRCRMIKHESMQLSFSVSRRRRITKANEAAITLQRGYRAHRFIQQNKQKWNSVYRPERTSQEMKEFFATEYAYPLETNPPIPKRGSNALVPEKVKEWISAHDEAYRPLARKFIHACCYRSHAKMERQLRKSVHSFNRHIHSLPAERRSYVIVVPNGARYKSNSWMSALACKYLATPPVEILETQQCKAFFEKASKNLSNIVYCDDGVFSGEQIRGNLDSLGYQIPYTVDINIHLIVPFISTMALQRINNRDVWISDHERMLDIAEGPWFNESEIKELRAEAEAQNGIYCGATDTISQRTITWFASNIPDGVSAYHEILSRGKLFNKPSIFSHRFVAYAEPPYKPIKPSFDS